MAPTVLVVNPRAGRGRVGRELPRLVATLTEAGADPTVLVTGHPGHAVDLARQASRGGAETVVAVGGDGTGNEGVNGLLEDGQPRGGAASGLIEDGNPVGRAALGVVAAGSGADFARSFAYPPHTGTSLRGIVGDTIPLDVGRLTFATEKGESVRYFVNVAEAGMGAATGRAAGPRPRVLGKVRYLVAFWPTLARFHPGEVTVTVNGERFQGRAHTAIIANGRFFGGGMGISPHSNPDDGIAALQINIGPKRQAFTLIPKIYKGTHLPSGLIVQLSGGEGMIETEKPTPPGAGGGGRR